jgi:hypothetical protein
VTQATFADVPHDQLFESFNYLDPAARVVPIKKLSPETVSVWKNLVPSLPCSFSDVHVTFKSVYL